jgi:AbrB family looped-hinge helix DNA binding protein
MNFENQNVSRKVDSLGRVSIPKGIRDRLSIMPNDEVNFWILDQEGTKFVCFTNSIGTEERCATAVRLLNSMDVTLPELVAYIEEHPEL